MTAALLDDLFTVNMPTQHTQTFSLSNLSLTEEIVDTNNDTADVGGDTERTPCAVDKSATDAATPPAGDIAARNLSVDLAYALSLGCHKEEYYLLISCRSSGDALVCSDYLTRSNIRNGTNLCLLACDLEFMDGFHRNST